MQTEPVFPWQQNIWQSLLQRKQQQRLPHALLFTGTSGVGKQQFARVFANLLLCAAPQNDQACGQCHACRLQQAKSHPDFLLLEPEEGSQSIKVDQVRDVVGFVNGTAMLGGYRVVIIHPATAMNTGAANALLKTLEEPTANVLIMLICQQGLRLPATISSRCQKIIFPVPSRDESLQWLQQSCSDTTTNWSLLLDIANNAPLQAKTFAENNLLTMRQNLYNGLLLLQQQQSDVLQFAGKWENQDILTLLNLLLVWLQDLLRCKVGADVLNTDYQSAMLQLINKFSTDGLLQYIDFVQQTYARILQMLNMNRPLLLKELFIRWVNVC